MAVAKKSSRKIGAPSASPQVNSSKISGDMT
jgi:hypothetical protein